MNIGVFKRTTAAPGERVVVPAEGDGERELGALAQEEVEALAESPLPPDPGEWFAHLTGE